jgi:hypothetical protein
MLRKVAAILTLVVVVACVSAKEYKGSITKLDALKKTVTVKVGDDEKTFSYTDSTEFVGNKGKTISQDRLSKIADKLGDKGMPATIVTEEKDGTEVVKNGNPLASKVTISAVRKTK